MFAYCNNNPIAFKDSNGNFCLPTAIIGGVLNAGVSILCTVFDSADNNCKIDKWQMIQDAGASFAVGFMSSGLETKAFDTAIKTFEAGYTFVTTVSRGGSIEEAVVNTVATVAIGRISDKAKGTIGNTAPKGAKKPVAASAAGDIVSSYVPTCFSGLYRLAREFGICFLEQKTIHPLILTEK